MPKNTYQTVEKPFFSQISLSEVKSQFPANQSPEVLLCAADTYGLYNMGDSVHSSTCHKRSTIGSCLAEWVGALAWTGHRTVPAGFESRCGKIRFGYLAIPFTPLCQCLSEETLKVVGPFYLVSMPGEVKHLTSPQWNV